MQQTITFSAAAGENMEKLTRIFQGVMLVGQLGFSLITPPLVFVWLARLAQTRLGWGAWVMIAAIVLGVVTGFATVYRTVLPLIKKDGTHKPEGRSFNDHI